MHRTATRFTSLLLVVLGVAMLVSTVARGGGPLALGVLLGLLFCAAGVGRLWVTRDEPGEEER
ncbi:hypothetical protein [Conexibacter sp. SYSU D00693]|uniref:hypothetical protein n=1 Tax=Conexibacter sp. SYSU D00693 TaxID=2812560 RepID=UPI00196B7181|nr:hypothetical protein [Conexibacter sp. SYSU D00693]